MSPRELPARRLSHPHLQLLHPPPRAHCAELLDEQRLHLALDSLNVPVPVRG